MEIKQTRLGSGESRCYSWRRCPGCRKPFEIENDKSVGITMWNIYARHVRACPESKALPVKARKNSLIKPKGVTAKPSLPSGRLFPTRRKRR